MALHDDKDPIIKEEPEETMTSDDVPVKEEKTESSVSFIERIRNIFKIIITKITIEPVLFLFMFSNVCKMVSFQDLLITKSCEQFLNATHDACMNLGNDKDLNTESQRYGNRYNIMHMLIGSLPAAVIGAFLGPWSDKYGRRYPLMIALTGSLIDSSTVVVLSTIESTPVVFFALCSIISGMTGGMLMVLTSCYSYLSDVTRQKNRAVRFSIGEFAFTISVPLGTLIGGQIFKVGGYVSVFMISPCCTAASLLYVVFFLKETKKRPENVDRKTMFKDLISTQNFKDCVQTCLRKRPGNLRTQLWLLMISMCATILAFLGGLTVGYPHAKTMYQWDVTVYSNVIAIFNVISSIIVVLTVPLLTRVLKVQDGVLGLTGCLAIMAENILKSAAFNPWIYYYAKMAGSLHSTVGIAVRTRLPKLTHPGEIGKVFSLLGVCESLVPMIGSALSSSIYTNSVKFFPGLVFAIMAGFAIVPTVIFIWILRLPEPHVAKGVIDEPSNVSMKGMDKQPEVETKTRELEDMV